MKLAILKHYRSVRKTEGNKEGHSHTVGGGTTFLEDQLPVLVKEALGAIMDKPLLSVASHK